MLRLWKSTLICNPNSAQLRGTAIRPRTFCATFRWLSLIENNTLIFFDEIQDFPEIATCFKSFAQQGKYDVISSGSLLGIQFRRIESISVGFQETAMMHSLDFEEFLAARGYRANQLDELYGHLLEGRAFGEAANTTLDRLFLDFSTLGGMPEVVERYFVKGTFEGVPAIQRRAIQRRIVNDYRSDVRKYAEGLDPVRIVNVFDSIPGQLAKENKKFQLSHVEKKARYKDYEVPVVPCREEGPVQRLLGMRRVAGRCRHRQCLQGDGFPGTACRRAS